MKPTNGCNFCGKDNPCQESWCPFTEKDKMIVYVVEYSSYCEIQVGGVFSTNKAATEEIKRLKKEYGEDWDYGKVLAREVV